LSVNHEYLQVHGSPYERRFCLLRIVN
jgi:hypothetical protein